MCPHRLIANSQQSRPNQLPVCHVKYFITPGGLCDDRKHSWDEKRVKLKCEHKYFPVEGNPRKNFELGACRHCRTIQHNQVLYCKQQLGYFQDFPGLDWDRILKPLVSGDLNNLTLVDDYWYHPLHPRSPPFKLNSYYETGFRTVLYQLNLDPRNTTFEEGEHNKPDVLLNHALAQRVPTDEAIDLDLEPGDTDESKSRIYSKKLIEGDSLGLSPDRPPAPEDFQHELHPAFN